jgi:hypothetical protein
LATQRLARLADQSLDGASGKGRALLSFVMPSSYFVETDFFKPRQGFMQNFAYGQAVHIDVQGISRTKKAKRVGFGFSQAPEPPTPLLCMESRTPDR